MSVENGTIVTAQDSIAHSGAVVSMGGDDYTGRRKIEVKAEPELTRAVIDARAQRKTAIYLYQLSAATEGRKKAEAEADIHWQAELRGKDSYYGIGRCQV